MLVHTLAQFSLYVHKGGLKPDSFHFCWCTNIKQALSLREHFMYPWKVCLNGSPYSQTCATIKCRLFPTWTYSRSPGLYSRSWSSIYNQFTISLCEGLLHPVTLINVSLFFTLCSPIFRSFSVMFETGVLVQWLKLSA